MKTKRYRPSEYDKTYTDKFGVEAFYSEANMCAIFYCGKKTKASWHLAFRSVERMLATIEEKAKLHIIAEEKKLDKKNELTRLTSEMKASDHFSVGDIIVNTWGWEQSNVYFYQVTDVLNKKIRVREVSKSVVEGSQGNFGMSCYVTPMKDVFVPDEEVRTLSLKVMIYAGKPEVVICNPESYYYFHKWDGRPEYMSWYA